MSNLREWLLKRRGVFYEGESLQKSCEDFLSMVGKSGVEVHEYPGAVIVLEPWGLKGNMRGWLLFDRFTKGTVSAMRKVTEGFTGDGLYAATHDVRIRDLLTKLGYVQYAADQFDYFLVWRGDYHGV